MHSQQCGVRVGEKFGREAILENSQSFGRDVHQRGGGGLGPAVEALPHALAPVELLRDWAGHAAWNVIF